MLGPQRAEPGEPGSLECAICFTNLEYMSISQREAHYEHHFGDDLAEVSVSAGSNSIAVDSSRAFKSPNTKKANSGSVVLGKSPKNWPFNECDVFWHTAQVTTPPSSHTPGLVQLLRKGLLQGHGRGNIRRAVLCNERVVHIRRELWDAGWGCGYRNFLMACSALMTQTQQPLYFPILESPLPPSIRNLQSWIEAAWRDGFDLEGQKQLKKLVGTNKWIGTSDLWVAFISRGIPAQLVDFDLKGQSQGCELLVNWVVEYFTPKKIQQPSTPVNQFDMLNNSPIIVTDKMPLILQHNGHSRTIVGFEVDKNGVTNLLLFDPAHRPTQEIRTIALSEFAKTSPKEQGPCSSTLSSKPLSSSSSSAGTYNLKRKRLLDDWSEKRKIPRPQDDDDIQHDSKPSPSNVLSMGGGHFKSSAQRGAKEPDLYGMATKFCFHPKALSKNTQYQILFFPMSAPLMDHEKRSRKEVRSIRIP